MRTALLALALVACAEPPSSLSSPSGALCEPGVPCPLASPEYCAHGPEAALYGRAAFADQTCVARDADTCRAATVTCAHFGQCSLSTTTPTRACPAQADRDFLASRDPACTAGTCVATGDDCQGSRVCREEGRCTAKHGVCVATDASCRAADLCPTLGWCTLDNDACRPTAADCARSERCTRFGACGLRGPRCAPCDRSEGCRQDGLCALVERSCRATDPMHCRASDACRREGRCRPHQGTCVR